MNIKGKLHRVTNVTAFVTSFLQTGGKPTTGFTNLGPAKVTLATDFPLKKFSGGFVPSMSFSADSNTLGEFTISVADAFKPFRGQIIVFKTLMMPAPFPGMPPLPFLTPIYRSAVFKLNATSTAVQKIFIFEEHTPNEKGISQDNLNARVGTLKKQLKLDRLSASIGKSSVACSAEVKGGKVTFNATVRGSTSDDLSRVIEVKAGDIDFDLPGPDFITTLCVDEDAIEAQIRSGLSDLSDSVSQQLLAQLNQLAPGLTSQATVSVFRVRLEQTDTRVLTVPITNQKIRVPIRSIVPDAAFGVPRALFP